MNRTVIAILLTTWTAFALSAPVVAQTQKNSVPPSGASADKTQQSNKGGQLRGLDRADQVAGPHGEQGRETARDAQLNRPDRPDRSTMPERPFRPERPGR